MCHKRACLTHTRRINKSTDAWKVDRKTCCVHAALPLKSALRLCLSPGAIKILSRAQALSGSRLRRSHCQQIRLRRKLVLSPKLLRLRGLDSSQDEMQTHVECHQDRLSQVACQYQFISFTGFVDQSCWPQEWSGWVRTCRRIHLVFVSSQTVDSGPISDDI